jgi:Heavy-metal resistance
MGLALAAELNGYPGPSHLLELADKVGLSDTQRSAVRSLFEVMKAETVPIGERLIEQEAALDRLFAGRTATPESVEASVASISETQGKLRAAHLKYHLATIAMLQPDQIERYGQLRGYRGDTTTQHQHH